jgi:DNA-binding winged helix-turn-helix (wHTH) protein/tetratricopeptide (TPR) repeat protein
MLQESTSSYAFGPFLLNPVNRLLLREGKRVSLTPKAFDTLLLLVEGRGDLLSKEQLMTTLWPDTFVEEANLAQHIAMLRKSLSDGVNGEQYIETVPKRGYRFVAPVTIVESHSSEGRVARPSLAVLPFRIFGEAADSFLGLSIADSLITRLSQSTQIMVRSTTTIAKFESASLPGAEAGLMLGVEFVLTGNLYKDEDRFRVNLQLVRVSNGNNLWTDQMTVTCENVFAVENLIVRRVERSLLPAVTGMTKPRRGKRNTRSGAAYRAYLKGRYFWNKRTDPELRKGIACFNEAIAIDQNYALAYAGLADSYLMLINWGAMSSKEGAPLAKAATMRALEIDPDLGEAHASLGYIQAGFEWDWAGSERELKRSIDLNPADITPRQWYAVWLTLFARWDEALEEIERAREIDPLSLIVAAVKGWTLAQMGRYEEARGELLRTLDLEPNYLPAHVYLARLSVMEGCSEDGVARLQKLPADLNGNRMILADLGHAYASAGREGEARRLLDQLVSHSAREAAPHYYLALVYAGLKDNEKAFVCLERAADDRELQFGVWFRREPRFALMREDPRHTVLLKRMNLR